MNAPLPPPRHGIWYGLAAYSLWGLVPIYFRALAAVPPVEILAHRVVWSAVFLLLLVAGLGRLPDVRNALRSWRTVLLLLASTVLIGANWFTFIHGVSTRQVLQTSLGYFLTPLVNVALGMVVLGERLRRAQWIALALAGCGVAYFAAAADDFPWIAVTLALSFGTYGLIRKSVRVDGLIGVTVETALLAPLALAYLVGLHVREAASSGSAGWGVNGLLVLSGVVTATPLLCFAEAARRLPLSTLGFVQYLSPSLTFLLAVLVFGEPFRTEQAVCFAFIWAALMVYTIDSVRSYRRRLGSAGSVA